MELDLPAVKINGNGSKPNDGDLFDVSLTDEESDKKNIHGELSHLQSHITPCTAFSSLNTHTSSPSVSSDDASRSSSQTRDPTPSAVLIQSSNTLSSLSVGVPVGHALDGVDSDSQLSEASAKSAHSTFSSRSGILNSTALADLNAELCDLKRTLHAESASAAAALLASHVPDLSLMSLDEGRASTTPGSVATPSASSPPAPTPPLNLAGAGVGAGASASSRTSSAPCDGGGSDGTLSASCSSSQSHSVATPSSPAPGVLVRPRAAPGGAAPSSAIHLPPQSAAASSPFSKGAFSVIYSTLAISFQIKFAFVAFLSSHLSVAHSATRVLWIKIQWMNIVAHSLRKHYKLVNTFITLPQLFVFYTLHTYSLYCIVVNALLTEYLRYSLKYYTDEILSILRRSFRFSKSGFFNVILMNRVGISAGILYSRLPSTCISHLHLSIFLKKFQKLFSQSIPFLT